MDQLKRMAIFAEVVASGSMTAASRRLGMTASAVSQQLRQLERELGVTLMHRSTRKLTLTEAGERYAAGCAAMVAAAREAGEALARLRDAPEGELRLTAPVGFARHLGPALGPLLAAHPKLTLRLLIDDASIDLIEQRIDLALRVGGQLADSSFVARKLGDLSFVLVASPAYLARRGWPASPADLVQHDWLVLQTRARPITVFELLPENGSGAPHVLRIEGRVTSTNQNSLQQLCVAGLGVAMMGRPDIEAELSDGSLVPVLPGWRLADMGIYAITPQRDQQPAKVRHAIEVLRAYFQRLSAS
jgi:DNA-binding transcriptional LysR family regulator